MYHLLAVFTILGGFGPIVAASALTFLTDGKEGVLALLRRGGDLRFDKIWWIPIFLAFPSVFVISYLLVGLVPTAPILGLIQTVPIYFFFGFSIAGEYGWRGYALDQLQSRFNALVSSLIIGIVWSFWYLPLFFTVGAPQSGWFFPFFAVLMMLASIMFTWLHNNTAGSVLTALVLHTSLYFMFSLSSNSILQTDLGSAIVILVMTVATASVTTYWGPGRLVTRDRSMNRKVQMRDVRNI
jgi:membrane protease YdiL (CAAX protease family)